MYRFLRYAIGMVAIAAIVTGGSGCGESTSGTQTTKVITIEKKAPSNLNKGSWKSRKPISPSGE